MRIKTLLAVALLVVAPTALADPPATQPTSQPRSNGWDPSLLFYQRSAPIAVEETTPTADQINFRHRPVVMAADAPEPVPTQGPVKPVIIDGIALTHLRFRSSSGEIVPALLCKPAGRKGPFPVVIAVHGMRSNKAQVCGQVAPALARRGFAVIAPDMPLHGERPGDIGELWEQRNLLRTAAVYRQAVINVRECIDLAQQRTDLDTGKGVLLAGYSMGSWINSVAGPADERVTAMVLMVGGAVDYGRLASLLPAVAVVDPLRAIAHFAPRPLLMLNAERDPVVTPEMGRRLFAAAAHPKRQIWYRSGHLLPEKAYQDAADWIARTWADLPALLPREDAQPSQPPTPH